MNVKLAEVTAIDTARAPVTTADGETYQGDVLVLAAGAQANFFNTPGADVHAFPLYSLSDAERLRARILSVFEDADRDPSLLDRGALTSSSSGRATGTDLSGALADMIHGTMTAEYHDLAGQAARVHLVDLGHVVLNGSPTVRTSTRPRCCASGASCSSWAPASRRWPTITSSSRTARPSTPAASSGAAA